MVVCTAGFCKPKPADDKAWEFNSDVVLLLGLSTEFLDRVDARLYETEVRTGMNDQDVVCASKRWGIANFYQPMHAYFQSLWTTLCDTAARPSL